MGRREREREKEGRGGLTFGHYEHFTLLIETVVHCQFMKAGTRSSQGYLNCIAFLASIAFLILYSFVWLNYTFRRGKNPETGNTQPYWTSIFRGRDSGHCCCWSLKGKVVKRDNSWQMLTKLTVTRAIWTTSIFLLKNRGMWIRVSSKCFGRLLRCQPKPHFLVIIIAQYPKHLIPR